MPSRWLKQWFPHLPSALDRAPMAGLMCAGALLLGVALAGARSSISSENGVASSAESAANAAVNAAVKPTGENPEKTVRLREGVELADRAGQFRMIGDRVAFIAADSQRRFIALENLTLERVAKTIADNPAELQWIVSGNVTEYRGSNYLALTRAQLKSQLRPADLKP